MYKFFIGCDMSKSTFDVSYFEDRKTRYLGEFPNLVDGFTAMVIQLRTKTKVDLKNWFVCFENTGEYSKALLYWLFASGIPCREENPLQIAKSLGLKRGKDDKADAQAICRYAYEKRDTIQCTKLPKQLIVNIKKLLSRRDLLLRQKNALNVSFKEQAANLDPDLRRTFRKQNKSLLATYEAQIEEIEHLLRQTIDEDDSMRKNRILLQTIVGIGPITAAYLLAYTQNFTCFTNSRKFASYIGVAPFPNRSGTFQGKTKVSHMANKKIKSIISNGVQAAIVHDPQIREYYKRKLEEGKEKRKIANAIKNKLVHRVFAVIKRQTPYVKLSYA